MKLNTKKGPSLMKYHKKTPQQIMEEERYKDLNSRGAEQLDEVSYVLANMAEEEIKEPEGKREGDEDWEAYKAGRIGRA